MAYKVKILPGALQDAEMLFRWLTIDSPMVATAWFKGIQDTINKLEHMPARFPRAPESDFIDLEIRHCIYKRNYRILFVIEGDVVRIYHIRHSKRQWMTAEEFNL